MTGNQLYAHFFKPTADKLVAWLILLAFSPIILFISFLLALANKGAVFFIQQRPGKDLRKFKLIKFKTMNDKRAVDGLLLPDHERLTAVGRFVRKTSLDELPQLINVLRGEMSLVGPRPLLNEYIPLYSEKQMRRHKVVPGITGWAQVNGRNSISWQEKFAFDLYYVENVSFALDLKILFITVLRVIKADGISGRGVATAEKFNGHN